MRRNLLRVVEDADAIKAREAAAIECILTETKSDPALYQRVVDRLRETSIGRYQKWSDYHLSRQFYAWVATADDDERPCVEFFLTVHAAHKFLSHQSNDKFSQEVRKRQLLRWALEQIQPQPSESEAETPGPIKKEKRNDKQSFDQNSTTPSSQDSCEKALPSVEQDSQRPRQQSATFRSFQAAPRLATPFYSGSSLKRQASSELEQEDASRPYKIVKTHYEPQRAKIPTTDAATQTTADYTTDMVSKVVDTIKKAFGEALGQQTRNLTDFLPMAVRQALRQDVADEVTHQQSVNVVQPRAMRPLESEVALAHPTYPTYVSPVRAQPQVYDVLDYRYRDVRQYEDVRTAGGRGGGRGVTTITAADLDRLMGLEAYRIARGQELRRL